jgi:hypothetical protein
MLVFFLFCLVVPAPSMADCETIPLQGPRDEPQMEELVQQCKNSESESNATVASLLGYAHRHGYGVPRNISAARRYFTDALSATDCEPYAVCGLKALAARSAPNNCNVDCSALANSVDRDEKDTPERDAKSRAYQLLAELLNSDPSIQRTAEELKTALNNILTQEEQLRNEAYQELCTGHVKRAVVTISVAHQLDREINRRDRLVQHHKEKVEEDGNARSQASLMQLQEAQSRSSHDKRVFFEKYAKAVFSASNCDEEILAGSYDSFEREIAEVAVTALEQSAYRLFQQHVNDARADRGMNSTWFDNLDTLLDQQ